MTDHGVASDLENGRRRRPVEPPRFLYFIQAAGVRHIKIGIAREVHSRLLSLQTGCPHELKIIGVVEDDDAPMIEKSLHEVFAKHRLAGERFANAAPILDYIRREAKLPPPPPKRLHRRLSARAAYADVLS